MGNAQPFGDLADRQRAVLDDLIERPEPTLLERDAARRGGARGVARIRHSIRANIAAPPPLASLAATASLRGTATVSANASSSLLSSAKRA